MALKSNSHKEPQPQNRKVLSRLNCPSMTSSTPADGGGLETEIIIIPDPAHSSRDYVL